MGRSVVPCMYLAPANTLVHTTLHQAEPLAGHHEHGVRLQTTCTGCQEKSSHLLPILPHRSTAIIVRYSLRCSYNAYVQGPCVPCAASKALLRQFSRSITHAPRSHGHSKHSDSARPNPVGNPRHVRQCLTHIGEPDGQCAGCVRWLTDRTGSYCAINVKISRCGSYRHPPGRGAAHGMVAERAERYRRRVLRGQWVRYRLNAEKPVGDGSMRCNSTALAPVGKGGYAEGWFSCSDASVPHFHWIHRRRISRRTVPRTRFRSTAAMCDAQTVGCLCPSGVCDGAEPPPLRV